MKLKVYVDKEDDSYFCTVMGIADGKEAELRISTWGGLDGPAIRHKSAPEWSHYYEGGESAERMRTYDIDLERVGKLIANLIQEGDL